MFPPPTPMGGVADDGQADDVGIYRTTMAGAVACALTCAGIFAATTSARDDNEQRLLELRAADIAGVFDSMVSSLETDLTSVAAIAGVTGGSIIDNPQTILAHNLPVEAAAQPLAAWLLLAATLLLPFDIAVRRLVITRGDAAKLAAWAGVGRRPEPVRAPARVHGRRASTRCSAHA